MAAADPAPASTPQLRRWARVRAVPALARVAWTDVVAFIGATTAMFPLLARRRPLGRERPARDVAATPADRRASEG
jgi:hypothetical protein